MTPPPYLLTLLLVYPILQRYLRHLRARQALAKYGFRDRRRDMTMDQASEIQRYMFELEFPDAFTRSLTYGFTQTLLFPDSSSLLVHTDQISNPDHSPKRFADTELLMAEIMSFPPSSPRCRLAISRMNYLHSRYASRITNDQLLYVLGVFACNPWQWVDRYEWRRMNDMEVMALGTFWKGIGEMMGIDFEPIKGLATDDSRYRADAYDAINWMLDMQQYLEDHDERHLGFNSDVEALVQQTLALGLTLIPKPLKAWAMKLGLTLFSERYRKAGGLPNPSPLTTSLVLGFMTVRKYFLRYVALPRPSSWTKRTIADAPDSSGRFHVSIRSSTYRTHPFYIAPTFWARWGPGALLRRLLGGPVPGEPGFRPEGYKIENIGPSAFEGKGMEWIEKDTARGAEIMPVGRCPFR